MLVFYSPLDFASCSCSSSDRLVIGESKFLVVRLHTDSGIDLVSQAFAGELVDYGQHPDTSPD